MPAVTEKIPEKIRPYIFHGVDLSYSPKSSQATAECPFCGKAKFSVNVQSGVGGCFTCDNPHGKKGGYNPTSFIRHLFDISLAGTKLADYEVLAEERRLLSATTLLRWGVCKSFITGEWMVPGYGIDGKLQQLYKYVAISGKKRLLPTPTLHHQIHGMNLFDLSKPEIRVCEGPWDGMALWEMMSQAKQTESGLALTSGESSLSLTAECNVIAMPGCEVFNEDWSSLFTGKRVTLMYDSDHPREQPNGRVIPPAGWSGIQRIAGLLYAHPTTQPESVSYLHWGENGHDPSLPSGYDVRDHLSSVSGGLAARLPRLAELLDRTYALSSGSVPGASTESKTTKGPSKDLVPEKCTDYKTLVNAWRKALQWTDGLDCALSAMLSSIISTMSVGDQLWFKIMAPPATGKSTLCEALAVAKQFILSKSTIRGFHSGFGDGGADQDHSLIAQCRDKTLIMKDGDTLLQSPNLGQILAEGRDVYDRVSRSSYRNKSSRDQEGVNMTWLLCGTASLRQLDSSELGARFLDCIVMESIDDELEDEILMRVANRAETNVALQIQNGSAESRQEESLTRAMCLTGGYVIYLREQAANILSAIEMEHATKKLCTRYGKFVAFMRARPSLRQNEHAEREMATRLVSQITRLAMCEAGVLNRLTVDDEVMRRVKAVTLHTSNGQVLDITGFMYNEIEGSEVKAIANHTMCTEDQVRKLLRFMRQIGIVDLIQPEKIPGGVTPRPRWHLTTSLRKLYADVMCKS